jgi:hypothetical protein
MGNLMMHRNHQHEQHPQEVLRREASPYSELVGPYRGRGGFVGKARRTAAQFRTMAVKVLHCRAPITSDLQRSL